MKQLINFFIFLVLMLGSFEIFAVDLSMPVGDWKIIDETTNRARCILNISLSANQTLVGKIVKSFPEPGKKATTLCTECTGENHNKPVLGMAIMWGFKLDGEKWANGRILDPTTGKIYRCYLKLIDNGNKLKVRGYVGIPLLGRTQIWERES